MAPKFTTLDARIVSAIGHRGKRTHRQIFHDKFVWRELMVRFYHDAHPLTAAEWSERRALLTRRLQVLRKKRRIRPSVFWGRWLPPR